VIAERAPAAAERVRRDRRTVCVVTTDLGPIDRLIERAETLAGAWHARARISTTPGQERALLRLFGVQGLDRAGHPLAGEVVDRYLSGGPRRLAGGIILPFSAALLEYDLSPQALALEVSAGTIDLGLEAELLRDAGRRKTAEVEARRLSDLALERIDANRTARRELLDLLGDAPTPWVGVPLVSLEAEVARSAVRGLVRDGADVVRVSVPAGRELSTRLHRESIEARGERRIEIPVPRTEDEPIPAGSQRGLALIRQAADEAAAERRAYVRLATVTPGLAAPEQAVVASFERVDVVAADPVAEIVDERVDPDRALADHAFAHRLYLRAGSLVFIGAGPLVVAPDLARGIPSTASTRAGRALALQMLGVSLVRRAGLPHDQIVPGALPRWLVDEPEPASLAIAQAVVRRRVFEGHPLAFAEPAREPGPASTAAASRWALLVGASLPFAGRVAFVGRDADWGFGGEARSIRAAAEIAAEVAASTDSSTIHGPVLEQARATIEAALRTLDQLSDGGWRAVLGERIDGSTRDRLGADAVVERTEVFDPLA
jgi:D-Lysine 5,6-aminomutase TIM-barrel domain of alpha subunit